jgi:hypothetical protein
MSGDNQDNDNTTGDSAGSDSTGDNDQSRQNAIQDAENSSDGANNDITDGKNTKGTVPQADYDAVFKRMQAADRAKIAAEKKLSDADKAKLDDVERAKIESQEAKDRADKAESALRDQKIFNAFLSHTDISWHDVNDAFTMLKNSFMDGVDVDENGKVTGIDPAVKKLAKEKAYLVKLDVDNGGSTGGIHNGQRKGDQNDTGKAARQARFPAAYGPR